MKCCNVKTTSKQSMRTLFKTMTLSTVLQYAVIKLKYNSVRGALNQNVKCFNLLLLVSLSQYKYK